MTRLALWAISVAVAYWLGREVEFRLWERTNDAPVPETDPMESVQPSDPWPPIGHGQTTYDPNQKLWVTYSGDNAAISWGDSHTYTSDNLDPTYLEATTLAAIRRSTQSSDVSTEGMS